MIEIKVERKPLDGQKGYWIKDFKALPLNLLPREYVLRPPCLWMTSEHVLKIEAKDAGALPSNIAKRVNDYVEITLHIGTVVSKEAWRQICQIVNEAGNRLKKIRSEQRRLAALNEELSKTWNGTKVYKW